MAKVLVVGGAGYVGGTTCAWLEDQGHEVWVLDNLSTGHRELVIGKKFIFAQAGDVQVLSDLFKNEKFDCLMHFAAKNLVGESVQKPKEYYENNVVQTRRLIDTAVAAGVKNFIFSSTCAIFGDPKGSRIHENLPTQPLSPYGQNKLEIENFLKSYAQSKGLRSIVLRYFNAAGAEPKLRVGEWHEPETHLIPKVFHALQNNIPLEIYGTDYSTRDGTCIRDYIHVWDLAQAHGLAMERLLQKFNENSQQGSFEAFNLGSEKGYSVREIIQASEEVIGKKVEVIEKERRAGDPPELIADSRLAASELDYGKNLADLKTVLSSAWEWEKKKKQLLRRAVFLDRDGTLNVDPGYLSDPAQIQLLPKVGEALLALREAGYLFVVVSNQSGVGRGLIPVEMMPEIHARLDELLIQQGVKINRYQLCFHHPDDECECRKPKPLLIVEAAQELGIDLKNSYMIGDNLSDLLAGTNAGCKGSILVRTGKGLSTEAKMKEEKLQNGQASTVVNTLLDAAHWILKNNHETQKS